MGREKSKNKESRKVIGVGEEKNRIFEEMGMGISESKKAIEVEKRKNRIFEEREMEITKVEERRKEENFVFEEIKG